jgi:hypothetical protein
LLGVKEAHRDRGEFLHKATKTAKRAERF